METSDIPSELAVLKPVVAEHVDGRGGFAIIVAMALIGLISLRAAPAPTEPSRVALADSEAWMACVTGHRSENARRNVSSASRWSFGSTA